MSAPDVDQDIIDMARGLFDSRVVVKRPPSAAQRRAYHAPPKGPPIAAANRPISAKARLNNNTNQAKTACLPPRPPWRPFTRASSLSKIDGQFLTKNGIENENVVDDAKEQNESSIYSQRTLPQGLRGLSEWLTEQVPEKWASGYSTESSFVFLPCLESINQNELPCVAKLQLPGDQLKYNSIQTQKAKPQRPRMEKNQMDFKKKSASEDQSNSDDQSDRVNHLRMYNSEGSLVHDIYRGKRGAELIKQEIRDLELLLQGIGNPEGSSIVVRYQYDINNLQNMVKSTLKDYVLPLQAARPHTPTVVALQDDLVKYPARHEEIMEQIRRRRDECVEELATIENKILNGKS